MIIVQFPQLRGVRTRALETSAIAIALALGGTAFAQCSPDPTVANGTTNCADIDVDGLDVTTYGQRVVAHAEAQILIYPVSASTALPKLLRPRRHPTR